MNERAAALGLTQTHFVTPSGLHDDDHYSTACDMAVLAASALQNENFREICAQSSAQVCFGNPPYQRWLKNSNKLLTMDESVIGVKTGFTDEAGRCLVSAAERNGVTLICVTLADPNDWQDHLSLYDWGFSQVTPAEVSLPEDWRMPVAAVRHRKWRCNRRRSSPWARQTAACRSWNTSWKQRRSSMRRCLPGRVREHGVPC